MATTSFHEDYLGRDLTNESVNAVDFLSRATTATADYLGRPLVVGTWTASTAYTVGNTVELPGGEELIATVAGTSGVSAPAAPGAIGGTVVDGTVTWKRTE